jgi:hypothetical protein
MNAAKVEADAGQDAERGRDPDRGRGGEAAHGEAFLDDRAGADEADAGHDALRHARRIEHHARERILREPMALVDGHQHQQARSEANERMGAESGRPAAVAALQPDQPAGDQRGDDAEDDLDVIVRHAPSLR